MNMNMRRFVQTALLLAADGAAFILLYFALGLRVAIGITIATKVIGLFVVLIQYPKYKHLKETTKALNEKLRQRHDNPDFVLNDKDMAGLKDVMFVGIYSHVAAFVLIPGPLSDIIGITLVFPPTSNRILDRFMAMAKRAQVNKLTSLKG